MRRARIALYALGVLGLLALPASAPAALSPSDFKNASKFCKALKVEMGATAFKLAYGTNANRSNAHGKCVSKHAKTVDVAQKNAAKECKAERDADEAAFAAKYGTNKNKTNAYSKCVSSKTDDATEAAKDEIVQASKTCKTERAADAAAFAEKYGTNKNNRNAYGKCVSKTVRES